MKVYLITAVLAVATVSTASAQGANWLNDAVPPPSGVMTPPASFGEACKQRGGNWLSLVPRTTVDNPWAKTMAPISGCWEAKEPLITFAEGPPIQVLDCEWRKLFEAFPGAKHPDCYTVDRDARAAGRAYATIAGQVVKRRGTKAAPPPAAVPVIPMQKLRGVADI